MAINNFKPFATAANANVTAQADWETLPALLSGFMAGKASSAQVNKAIRQASFIAAALAQYTANKSGLDVLDDGDLNGFVSKMGTAFGKDFQALDATLTALAGLATGANKLPYFTGTDTAAQTDLTSVGRDIIGKSTIADILTYLGFPELGIAGTGTILPSLDWQQFNFVPGARYFIKSSDMSNVPAQIVITQPTFNAVMDVIGYDGITRHVDIWFSSTPDEYFSRYQVMIAGHQGSRTFSVRRIWTSSEPVPLSGGGTGADNVSSALNNFGIGPIANASEVTAGTSKKLIDAALLKAFLPKRSFQANDVIRIPDQPGGLMVQFGTLTGVSGSDVISSTLTFPELFPNACLAVIPVAVSSDTGGGMVGVQVKTPTRSNADIFIYERNGGAIAAHSVQYIAIGW